MLTIGETRGEAVDWIQEKLNYARRDVAEETLALLLVDGLVAVRDEGVLLLEEIPEEELREKSRRAMASKEFKNARIMRRRAVPTQRGPRITNLNYIDSDGADAENEDKPLE